MLTFNAEYARDQAIHNILSITEEVSELVAENRQLKVENERLKCCELVVAEEEHCGCGFCTQDENYFTRNLLSKTANDDSVWEVFIDLKYKMLRLTHGKFVADSIVIDRCPMCGRKL